MLSRKNLALAIMLQLAALPVLTEQSRASNVGVDLNIHVGGQPRPVVVTPAPEPRPVVVVAPPAYQPEPYYDDAEEEVEFVYPQQLGFYVAVGVPYDLFYLNNLYFVYRDGRWLRSASSRGGWVPVRYRELPPTLRRHRMERIREYRTREYVVYQRDREHYRGKHRSDRGYWKAVRHQQMKDDKRFEKEQRREAKHFDKEQRKEEKRFEKEQRREEKHYDRESRGDERRSEREHRGRD